MAEEKKRIPRSIEIRGARVRNLKNIGVDIPPVQIVDIAGVSGSGKSSLALDVKTLLRVFQTLINLGATEIVIEHGLDMIRGADYIIDMGPGGGNKCGRIVAAGTVQTVKASARSITGSL